MVLRAVVQSEEMMNMLRHAGLATGEKEPPAEPKMTRAMARKVEAEGLTVPYLVAPATPPRIPDPEVVFLAGGLLQPEEEGERDTEYRPDLDPFADDDDDDSLFSEGTPRSQREESFNSCLSTPTASQVFHFIKTGLASRFYFPQGTPNTSRTPDHGTFKRPFLARGSNNLASRILDFDSTPPANFEGYSTRSKNPMTDRRIEDIEQQFIPFDITPDMYDLPLDNDDYSTFLKEMYNEEMYNDEAYNEEEDVEFVYCPDEADEHTKDPEEHRNDKATKVTKKEVAELMAELCEFADSSLKTDADDSKKKKSGKKKRVPLPGEQIFEAIKEHTTRGETSKVVKETTNSEPLMSESKDSKAEAETTTEVTFEQREQLGSQISQHIQLLTQMSLLSSHNNTWRSVKGQCSTMLGEVAAASLRPGSVAAQTNLYTSLAVVSKWEDTGRDPTTVTKNKNSKKYKKRNVNFDIADSLIEFMAHQRVFYFPALLPTSALAQDCSRIAWTEGEDHLLALALAATAPSLSKTQSLTELSFALQARYMRAKSAVQIRARIKNLKVRDSEEASNPVVHFIKTGEARTSRVAMSTTGNGGESLLEMLRVGDASDFSPLWTRKLHGILQRRGSESEPRRLQPAPSVLPFPPLRPQAQHIQKVILVPGVPLPNLPPPSPPPIHRAILCVDGQTGTPTSTSEGEDGPPPPSSKDGRSPIKLKIKLRTHPYKSPMKAASERILRKYSVSPRKLRPLRPIHIKARRESAPCSSAPRNLPLETLASPTRSPPRAISPPPSEGGRDMADSVETPTTLARRKSRGQKEAELTLALVGPLETVEEKELREGRESREMFEQIRKAIAGNDAKQHRFAEIIDSVETAGTVATYTSLHTLLSGHPIVQESLLDLLSDAEAQELGDLVFSAHQQRVRMKQFVLRLSVAYRHQPAYHARVLRELDALCSDPHLAPETLRAAASRLFKHNAFLLEQFLLLVPGTEPPEGCLPSPEVRSDTVVIEGEIFRCILALGKRFSTTDFWPEDALDSLHV